jgi:hypothetical protein
MLTFGQPPFLECSSKGDKRFSAFYARIKRRGNRSIEELYQSYKLFENDVSGLSPKEAKGRHPINMDDCRVFYTILWNEYFKENPDLLSMVRTHSGFSDIFGQAGHVCQAAEIYHIAVHGISL